MNKSITLSVRKRSKLIKIRYQYNRSFYIQEALFNQAREYAALATEGKERYITNMRVKLDNP